MYDNAVLGCGTCNFDCRFCIGLFPSNVKVITQILSSFSSGCKGQNAIVSPRCSCQLILQVLVNPHRGGCSWDPFLRPRLARHGTTGRIAGQRLSVGLPVLRRCLFARCRPVGCKAWGIESLLKARRPLGQPLHLSATLSSSNADLPPPISLLRSALAESPVDYRAGGRISKTDQESFRKVQINAGEGTSLAARPGLLVHGCFLAATECTSRCSLRL